LAKQPVERLAMKNQDGYTQHILVRYGEQIAPEEGTISAHDAIIRKKGFVWLGKFGKKISQSMYNILKKQIKKDKPTYIFMIKRDNKKYVVHAAVLEDVVFSKPDTDYIPEYYANKRIFSQCYFKIIEFIPINSEILYELIGRSSNLPIIETLAKSMAGMMYVKLPKNKDVRDFAQKN
jgi:hypothetical protein